MIEHPVYVFDIDGTLADCSHRMHFVKERPKNWKAFFNTMHLDTPVESIIDLLKYLSKNATIVFCTGRPNNYRQVTVDWLYDNLDPYLGSKDYISEQLYMRDQKDNLPDYVTKLELCDEIIEEYGKIDLWFDDRQGVVDALRAKGVKVLQVSPSE